MLEGIAGPPNLTRDVLRDGVARPVRAQSENDIELPSCAIVLQGNQQDSWLLDVFALLGTIKQPTLLGRLRTFPWGSGARTVAIAAHPYAHGWQVRAKRAPVPPWLAVPTDSPEIEILLATSHTPGQWGLTPCWGMSEFARQYGSVTGTNGNIPVSGRILGWSADNTNAVPAHVKIHVGYTLLNDHIVPANSSERGPGIEYQGEPVLFEFIGTTNFVVSYETIDPNEGAGQL
jgi:hypothetical protein